MNVQDVLVKDCFMVMMENGSVQDAIQRIQNKRENEYKVLYMQLRIWTSELSM